MSNISPEEMIAWLESRLSYTCPITEIPVLTSEAAILAIRSFIQKHSDPDMVMVPRVPTEKMEDAGIEASNTALTLRAVWDAMIEAAKGE